MAEMQEGAFDSYAQDYDAALNQGLSLSGENKLFFARGRVALLADCLERLGFRPETVLDYGCGTGTSTPYFIELLKAESVIGIDPSAGSLEVAERLHTSLSSCYLTPDRYTPSGSVDLVFCNGVFHHIPPAQRGAAVKYIADCLRPGGLFAFWENNPWNPGTRWVMSRIPFDRDAITLTAREARSLGRSAGLEVLRTDYVFFFPRFLRALRGMELYLRRFPFGGQYRVLCRKAGGTVDALTGSQAMARVGTSKAARKAGAPMTFAVTFPPGTHAMWMHYYRGTGGINPDKDVALITIPPPQMVANMEVGKMDGFCVGEPWNARAIAEGIGYTSVNTQDMWKDHPEKVCAFTAEFAGKNPKTVKAVLKALHEASAGSIP
jgi:SAM-dependent methyltransferase